MRLATGQGTRALRRVVGQVESFEPLVRPLTGLTLRCPACAHPVGDVLDDAEVVEQHVVLEDESGRTVLRFDQYVASRVVDDHPVDLDTSTIERHQTCEAAQHGALARTVRSQERDDLARRCA